jgi:threonine 3-dehydrogenase
MKGMMKAARKVRREPGMDLVDTPIPTIQANEVLVKVGATAICGSDIHFYNWDEFAQSRLKNRSPWAMSSPVKSWRSVRR